MSQENVDRLLESAEAFNRNDVNGLLQLMDPEVQFEPQLSELEGDYSGHDGMRRFFADAAEIYSSFLVEYPDVRDLGDQVLALGIAHTRAKGSGLEQDVPLAIVATFRDGRITRMKDFARKDQALEALGLVE